MQGTAREHRPLRVTTDVSELREETREVAVDDGTELGLFVVHPQGTPRGALIVLQEIFGVNDHIRDVTRRFAALGLTCVAPDLFHRIEPWWTGKYDDVQPGVQRAMETTQDHIRADLRATHGELRKTLGDAAKVAAIGFCMGGRQAYVANGILDLACAISFYGSNIVGLPELAIKQSGPMLLVWGGRDRTMDEAQRRATAAMLRTEGKTFVEANFDAAQHGFFCDARSAYHAPSAKQAFALATAFLDSYL